MASFWSNLKEETQLSLQEPRRYLALSLPRWATDCLKRADLSLAASRNPLVLWEKQKGAMRLAALDEAASAYGFFVGQSLSDARAINPQLEAREIDRGYIEHAFANFADWHSNASPMVSVLTDHAAYGDLVLDITGVSHLFGGEQMMLATLTQRLSVLGFTVDGAIALSIGGAWALAHYRSGAIVETEMAEVLADLPVAALRLDEMQISLLVQMGLKQIGDLYQRDRRTLTARFGATLVSRLDQATGTLEERLIPRLPVPDRHVDRRFADPIALMDDVLMTTRDLAIRLAQMLEAEGVGAQTFHLFLYRIDHQVMTLSVNASRATRDPQHIARLFTHRAERLEGEYDAGFGIDMIRLAASSVSPVSEIQIGAFETNNGAEDLDRLYDRMTSRLGPLAVVRSKFVNTHIPEQAVKLEPLVSRTPDDALAMPDGRLKRPLRLLPMPELIAVSLAEVPDGPPPSMVWRGVSYRFAKVAGPERIGVEWWTLPYSSSMEDDDGSAFTRDYYVAEDDRGRRFWLFRQGLYAQGMTQSWYMHGLFA
jgi:protein ImuB